MMKATLLNILLVSTILVFSGCGGGCPQNAAISDDDDFTRTPKFNNGDIVRLKMLWDRQGIVKRCDYRYQPKMKAWNCIVDFYPSSFLGGGIALSEFENYERRYVYEFELELVERYSRYGRGNIRRWMWLME